MNQRLYKLYYVLSLYKLIQQMLKAPDGCLQFHTNISGNVKSFNYKGVGCFSNDHVCDPDNLESCEFVAGDTPLSHSMIL